MTLLELTVRPLQLGRQGVADDYEVLLEAAGLRARHRLRTPDAIQIATGVRYGATLANTNDEGWRDLSLIETVVLSDLIE